MLINYGLSIIPTKLESKEPALSSWRQFQKQIATEKQYQKWFGNGSGYCTAIISGQISGNLEMLDFDFKAKRFEQWRCMIPADLFQKLVIETSQSGGRHVIYRLLTSPAGNQKIARRFYKTEGEGIFSVPDSKKKYQSKKVNGEWGIVLTDIETRGEGGYFLCNPSPGYQLVQNDFSVIPVLTAAEHDILIQAAKACNQFIEPAAQPFQKKSEFIGVSAWEDYDNRADPTELLCDFGWQRSGGHGHTHSGAETVLLRRPGKDHGVSGSVINGKVFYCFSSNAYPFQSDKGYYPSAVYALLKHNGDFSAAAKELYQLGFGDRQKVITAKPVSGAGCFWYEDINTKGDITLNISHSGLLDFLEKKGIYNSEFQKEKILIRNRNNILSICEIDDIRNWLLGEFFKEFPEKVTENKYKSELREVLTKGINIYVQPAKIETLIRKPINLLRDTENETFFFFRNRFVKVTADKIESIGYDKIKADIWADSINPHNISLSNDMGGIYEKFVYNISGESEDRYNAICTAHGYLLNRFNNPAYPKAVVLSDGITDDTPNGGTGKGIIAQALSYLRNQAYIDGKKTDLKNTFALQNIELQTEFILFDDVAKNFPFEMIFSDITTGYQIEKKNKNKFSFKPDENPKTLITTNYAIRGTGHSFERRKAEVELFPYYGQNGKKPEDDFGTLFTWDVQEWNKFYNFLFRCVQMFHKNNNRIAEYQSETLELKKTISEIGLSFFEYAEKLPKNEWLAISEIYEKYMAEISKKERDFMSGNKFSRLLTSYTKGRGYCLERKNIQNVVKVMIIL